MNCGTSFALNVFSAYWSCVSDRQIKRPTRRSSPALAMAGGSQSLARIVTRGKGAVPGMRVSSLKGTRWRWRIKKAAKERVGRMED